MQKNKQTQDILSNSSVNVCWHKHSPLIHSNVVFGFVNSNSQVYIFVTSEAVTSKSDRRKKKHAQHGNSYFQPIYHTGGEQTGRAHTIKHHN